MQIVNKAILGLVLFLFNGRLSHLVAFVLLSFVLMLSFFPRWSAWEEARNAYRMTHPDTTHPG